MRLLLTLALLLLTINLWGQTLKIRARKPDAPGGSAFVKSISDTSLPLAAREKIIYKVIRSGNIPDFYRNLVEVRDSLVANGRVELISYFVLPDYVAIGSDSDYFYCPMTPHLAQRVANKLKCSLPTRKMVDRIYRAASVRLTPSPIPPTPAMTTVPVFERHSQIVKKQRDSVLRQYPLGNLVGGDKKDIIISNRIYNDTSDVHVVIYGWHRLNGKAIQPLYARHLATWADYSHGVRMVQQRVWVNGKKTKLKKVLRSATLNALLSDEGVIRRPSY